MIKFQPSHFHTALPRFADPNALKSQKNSPAPTSETVDSPPPSKQNVPPILSRSRRDLQNPARTPDPRVESIRKFAEALVERDDRELAKSVANSLIRQRLASETRSPRDEQEKVVIPPHSTFGKLWSELADALESEPFKSFAEAKLLDISKLIIGANGELTEKSDGGFTHFFERNDPEWSAASSAVLAAAKKLMTSRYPEISFYGRDQALAKNVAEFYGLQLGSIKSNDTLSAVGRLLHEGGFKALSSSDPFDAPIKQRQREAQQWIVDLPPHALGDLLDRFTPLTAREKVQEADKELAQLVSQGLMKLVPEASDYETSVTLPDIPEYSTFNLVRKNLLAALTGSTFTTFAQDNNLDPTSVRINPVSGVLTGQVNGVNTTFSLNDVSGWADVWVEIQDAVQLMAAGSEDDITYPTRKSAPLYEVMAFYNEPLPHQEDTQQRGWEQRQLVNTLGRIDEMNQNKGFKALIDPAPSDPVSAAVKRHQQAMTQQLADRPLSPSSLETLAAAVKANNITPVEPVETEETRADVLANAESELATTLHRAMLELKTAPSQATSKTIQPIPTNSLFGQWWDYLGKALKGHGFIEWASQQNIDLTSLRYDPTDKALIAKVNGVEQRFTATDFGQQYPEHFDVLTPVLAAAQAFAVHGQPITLPHASNSSVPYQWVANFYGVNGDPSSSEFEQQIALMGSTRQFPEYPGNPQKVVNWLNRQKTALGDSNDRYALIAQLKKDDVDNDDTRFVVDPDSTHQPKGMTTLRQFLIDQNWYTVNTTAERANLLKALQTPIPRSPALGNYWGFLSTDIPLSADQRSQVTELVKKSIGSEPSLLSYLNTGVTNLSTDPAQALEQLLSSDKALEFATNLQTEMKGSPTSTSLKQWLLTALVLELDPTAGIQHKTVAGVDLMGIDNSGRTASYVIEKFNHHLLTEKKIPAELVPAVSRLLILGTAPQLLLAGIPNTVTVGSKEMYRATVATNRINWSSPAATANMTYQQVMDHDSIRPLSALEASIESYSQMNPLLDWAAINDNLNKDNYTLEQLKNSQTKLQTQMKDTAEARNWLKSVEPPNRRAMTLKTLREEFGTDIDYESRYMIESFAGGLVSGYHYSLAEIYEAGRLGESWIQEGKHVDFERLRKRANEPDFPVVNDEFDNSIKADFKQRRRHTVILFEDMVRNLPVEERNSVVYGAVEFLNVESSSGSGMVMTSVYKGVRRDFAVYPASGQIVRIADIDPSTPIGEKVSLTLDAEAFKSGAEPKKDIKSEVVLTITDQHLLGDNDEPWPLEVLLPAHNENDELSPDYERSRISKLAKVMVDSTYLNKTQFINLHRNWFSNTLETAVEPSDFFKAIWHSLPGTKTVEDIYHGEFFKAGIDLAVDVAILLATEGTGKLWSMVKAGGSWAATKISAGFIERFGAKEAESIELTDMTALSTSESLNATGRMQGSGGKFSLRENMADGFIAADAQETTKVSAIFQDDEWYAYNARTLEAEGPALGEFAPVSDRKNPLFNVLPRDEEAEKELIKNFENKVTAARKEAGYKEGYDKVNLDKIPGYTPNMGPESIAKLISESEFNAEQIGSLIRQREKIKMDAFQRMSEGFMLEMKAAGGTVRAMPQTFYLSLTRLSSPGECAGLSTAMAMAIMDGSENTLFDNLITAAARPALPANAAFLENLSKLEETMMFAKELHGGAGSLVPYDNIIKKMSGATETTTWIISAQDHAMVVGVRVDPTNISKKIWYCYEPNYGLAKFESERAMKRGMPKLLKNGEIGSSQIHFGTGSKPIYGMSTFNPNNLVKNNWPIESVKKMSQPL
ncbi:hypothetical protein [Pseudomonas khavaziana]|uniref:Uncharacterized protein n=1 Tax=Pseudomonas khavaziana TaxID=2842351 RepID=A0ABZ2DM92_9PSED